MWGLSLVNRHMKTIKDLIQLKTLAKTLPMPVLFVGHGNPMNAIEDNSFTQSWRSLSKSMVRPQAIVVISAHWVTDGHNVTGNAWPQTIHDFYGFPDALYNVHYRAPGLPELAEEVSTLVPLINSNLTWGFDHGTWSVLNQMYPSADIPVLQLSINQNLSPLAEAELISQLRFLRNYGVLFIGSGNIIHNLGLINWQDPRPYDWALSFDAQVSVLLEKRDLQGLANYHNLGKPAHYSIPTDEHYRPMLAALALADTDDTLEFFNEAILMGSIGMRSFILRK